MKLYSLIKNVNKLCTPHEGGERKSSSNIHHDMALITHFPLIAMLKKHHTVRLRALRQSGE